MNKATQTIANWLDTDENTFEAVNDIRLESSSAQDFATRLEQYVVSQIDFAAIVRRINGAINGEPVR